VAKSCLETTWGKVDLALLMQQLDRLIRDSGKGELLMTAFAACIGKERRQLGFCVAGHPAQLLVRRDGAITPMFARSSHLGRAGDGAFSASVVDYGPGDRLVLFTDGILERRSPAGSEYGIRRLQKSALRHREASPEQMVAEMRRDLETFAGGVPAEDDLTLVVAELE
jgi:sigma-B regulation protein RsbU (phosphoserine phosphatase)